MRLQKYRKVRCTDETDEELDPFSLNPNQISNTSSELINNEVDGREDLNDREPLLSSNVRSYLESTSESVIFFDSYETGDLTTSSLISHPLQPDFEGTSYKDDEGEVERRNDRNLDNLVGSSSSSLPSLSSSPTHHQITFSNSEFQLPPPPTVALPLQQTQNESTISNFSYFNLFNRFKPWSLKRSTAILTNDGVFFNLNAKPAPISSPPLPPIPTFTECTTNCNSDGEFNSEVNSGNEFESDTNELPNYQQVLDEPSPPSFDLHNVLPSWAHPHSSFLDYDATEDPIIDGLPLGSLVVFVITMFFSSLLQFVGFILTYLVHTDHAGRLGSLAGLGITFLQVGYGLRNGILQMQFGNQNFHTLTKDTFVLDPTYGGTASAILVISYVLMAMGWYSFLYGSIAFFRYSKLRYQINTSSSTAAT